MKKGFIGFTIALALVILLSPCLPQAAGPTAPAKQKAAELPTKAKAASGKPLPAAEQPQPGGVFKVLSKNAATSFGYPPNIVGPDRDFASPFFNRLIAIGDDGQYQPELALSWDAAKDGKSITFKLRRGVTFHDGTPFNAKAVKANFDNLIPPKANLITGISSVEVVDEHTVRINLTDYNNLILYQLASDYPCYLYSPSALEKNGVDWAVRHPVGTGPFMLKDFQPNASLTYVKNPNYWEKGLPYLDGMEFITVRDPMSQVLSFKAGQANAIYAAPVSTAAELREAGYPLLGSPGNLAALGFDAKNSEYFSKRQVREAIEYAIDKEAICNGPGQGLYAPAYQIVASDHPDYNKSVTLRKYDPAKTKKLLAEAGYPNGFSFKAFFMDTIWKDGLVAVQSYLAAVGIKMDINYLTSTGIAPIRALGKIEKGAATYTSLEELSNSLWVLNFYFRSDSNVYQFMTRPAGSDALIDKAKTARDSATATKIKQQLNKLIYDDATMILLWDVRRIAVVDKSVRNAGWFIAGDSNNNQVGTRTWFKK